jgi:hypothetical protein
MERSRIGSMVSSLFCAGEQQSGGPKLTFATEVSSKEPLKRRTKVKAPPKPKKENDGEGEPALEGEVEGEAEVTSMLETNIRRDLARYPDAILLTQVGSFFEVGPFSLSHALSLC